MNKPILIIIAGGTSSGKTTTVKKIVEKFSGQVVNLCAENYIAREDIHLTLESSCEEHLNHHSKFNNPERMEKECLLKDLEDFLDRKKVKIKVREKDLDGISSWVEKEIKPDEVIILEGVNALQDEEIRNMADWKIYVDADENVRLTRKILRSPWCRKKLAGEISGDLRNYGKSLTEALFFWEKGTNPAEKKYVITTRDYADLVINSDNWLEYEKSLEKVLDWVELLLKENNEEIKKQLSGWVRTGKGSKDETLQKLSDAITRLTKIKNLAEEKEIKELENLQNILEKIQKKEITKTKIEVLRLTN